MIIGVPEETKNQEKRVAMIPGGVLDAVESGHTVLVEKGAGDGAGYPDEQYEQAGAKIVSKKEAWSADIVMKVKEPLREEYRYFRKNLILFTYLHLAGVTKELTDALLKAGVTGIAYETVEDRNGKLPLLMPMSAIAGKMATQVGAQYLSHIHGGRGILIDGIPGVHAGKVIVLGGGSVGSNAAKAALGRGAKVTIIDRDIAKLTYLEDTLSGKLTTLMSNYYNIRASVKNADLVIGCALIPGAKAPVLVTEEMVKRMKPGTVLVDVAIDQGGCIETSKPTTHDRPVFVKHGAIHYCVPNMPGAYPRTATKGIANATIGYLLAIANRGLKAAMIADPGFYRGMNTYKGYITNFHVAKALNMQSRHKELKELLW